MFSYITSGCIRCKMLQTCKKYLIMINPKYSITPTIERNVIDIIYVGELGIHTVLTYHCATFVRGPIRCLLFCIWPLLQIVWTPVISKKSQSLFPHPMANRAAHISVSIALGVCECSESYSGGWSTGSSASLTFPLHSHISSARREGSEYHF